MSNKKSIFFIVKYIRTVNKQTRKPEILETVYLADKISRVDMLEAAVILDLLNGTLEKTRAVDTLGDYESAFKHFRNKYPKKIDPIMEEFDAIQVELEKLKEEMQTVAESKVEKEIDSITSELEEPKKKVVKSTPRKKTTKV